MSKIVPFISWASEYELGQDGDWNLFIRFNTPLGSTSWKVIESGDGPFEDACFKIRSLYDKIQSLENQLYDYQEQEYSI